MPIFLLILNLCFFTTLTAIEFDQVVLWGHKLHTHTHSYIHNGFSIAFQYLGYPVLWLDDQDEVSDIDFARTLFITEGQVDKNIPLRDDCYYILHNCYSPKYDLLFLTNHAMRMQVYTDPILTYPGIKKLAECIYADFEENTLYMPWATDLLPEEIEVNKNNLKLPLLSRKIYWVGTIGGGLYGNNKELNLFKKACEKSGIEFIHNDPWAHGVSIEQNIEWIQNSYIAPAIVGSWQSKMGYIPCRIFKNISYGHLGVTNSYRVWKLFNQKIVYNKNTYLLFYEATRKLHSVTLAEVKELMDFVKDHHTYINRIDSLLKFFDDIQ